MDVEIDVNRSVQEEIRDVNPRCRPHIVILGAGASCQALPNGDKRGRKIPLLKEVIETIGLAPVLREAGVKYEEPDFEAVYSKIAEQNANPELLQQIERLVFDYFSSLELPDEPTLYDHLILSLREHDLIATFNWDPFLAQAFQRHGSAGPLPKLLFLHGNVAIGYCDKHRPISMGNCGNTCRQCGEPLSDPKLLYPITRKDYSSDPAISASWREARDTLKQAFMLTIFGYSAPATDAEAMELLQEAWGRNVDRSLEEIEIIDTRDESDLLESWSSFIHSHHRSVHKDFYDCFLAQHPRRSVESMWAQVMDRRFIGENPLPRQADFGELNKWCKPLLSAEEAALSGNME